MPVAVRDSPDLDGSSIPRRPSPDVSKALRAVAASFLKGMALDQGTARDAWLVAFQVEQIHEQLRQGWPLTMAVRHVALMLGRCPIRSRPMG